MLAVLCDAYVEEEERTVLRLPPHLAPNLFGVLPLAKKPPQLEMVDELHHTLSQWCVADVDVAGSVGKRYRRQDEVGTPYCITVDYDSEAAQSVTVRGRDSMRQIRVPLEVFRSEERAMGALAGLR